MLIAEQMTRAAVELTLEVRREIGARYEGRPVALSRIDGPKLRIESVAPEARVVVAPFLQLLPGSQPPPRGCQGALLPGAEGKKNGRPRPEDRKVFNGYSSSARDLPAAISTARRRVARCQISNPLRGRRPGASARGAQMMPPQAAELPRRARQSSLDRRAATRADPIALQSLNVPSRSCRNLLIVSLSFSTSNSPPGFSFRRRWRTPLQPLDPGQSGLCWRPCAGIADLGDATGSAC